VTIARWRTKSAARTLVLTWLALLPLLRAQSSGRSAAQEGFGFPAGETPAVAAAAFGVFQPPAPTLPEAPSVVADAGVPSARDARLLFATAPWPYLVFREPSPGEDESQPGANSKPTSAPSAQEPSPTDFNRSMYYKNKLEFSLDGGWLPINIPFVFDVFLGDGYTTTSLKYTLVPIIGSLRWQVDDVGGPWIFRGNWDLECSGAVTLIPRGPETRYFAWILGFRRNFVPRRGRIAPYFDGRVGLGDIDAKEPLGVLYAQGQDFTFTLNMGSGVRYNFNPRYSISAGLNWMHISNLYLSQPQFSNYGINVYGPMFGFNVQLFGHRHQGSQ
jgi:hypothetical protein